MILLQLNQAVRLRLSALLEERNMTQYQLFMLSGVPKSTIHNLVTCTYDSLKLRIIHELFHGFQISISDFFNSPLFDEVNLAP